MKKSKKNIVPKIIEKINDHSKDKFKEISKILDKNINYTIKFDNNQIILFHENNKYLVGNFNFYGIITPDSRFMWAYMIPGIDKKLIKSIYKIKSFSHLFEDSDNKIMMFYHQVLTQDSILVNKEEMDLLNKLILYLGEDIYFFNTNNSSNNLQLIFLSKINERFN